MEWACWAECYRDSGLVYPPHHSAEHSWSLPVLNHGLHSTGELTPVLLPPHWLLPLPSLCRIFLLSPNSRWSKFPLEVPLLLIFYVILFSVRVLTVSATQDWHSQPPSQCDHVDVDLTGTTHMASPRPSSCSRWLVLPLKHIPNGMLLSPSSAPCQPPTCLLGLCQWPPEFSAFALDLS